MSSNSPSSISPPSALSLVVSVLIICSISNAGDSTPPVETGPGVFELSTNPILEGDRLAIGNARRVSATEADGFAGIGPRDDEVWQRCLQIGPTWLSESGDGSELELQWPWGAPDKHRLLTAQCGDGAITIGGYAVHGTEDNPELRALLFLYDPTQTGPVTLILGEEVTAGSDKFTLNEVRTIDPLSGTVVFAATTKTGAESYLVAPYRLGYDAQGHGRAASPRAVSNRESR